MSGTELPMLVSTGWLAEHLDDPDLRVLDASVHIIHREDGRSDARSGRESYLAEHIAGAQFADVLHVLSDRKKNARFAIPAPDEFAAAMEALGVGKGTRVVVYSSTGVWWATRVWWLLRYHGFEPVAVLDGGLQKWKAEGWPVTSEVGKTASAEFRPEIDQSRIAMKQDVLEAISEGSSTSVLDVLSPEYFRGELGDIFGYERIGHIAGAANFPTETLMRSDGTFRDEAEIANSAAKLPGKGDRPAITYCGGGIAATQTAFALELAGLKGVRVYDGSLEEWAADPLLPMRTGPD